MNFALVAALGLSLGQPPAPASDYYPFNSHSIKFPIALPPSEIKNIRKVELHVSTDGGQVWQLAAVAPPTQDKFAYKAPHDGRYWFHIQTEDLKGKKEPADLTKVPPAMKVLFDTTAPKVAFTNAKRTGDEVVVEWKIEDQFPKVDATRVYFRPLAALDGGWQEVTLDHLPPNSRNGVRFGPKIIGPIVVRVVVADVAGNTGEGFKEIPGIHAGSTHVVASVSPEGVNIAIPTIPPPSMATPASATVPPPDLGSTGGPLSPVPAIPSVIPPAAPNTPVAVPSVAVPLPAVPSSAKPLPPPAPLISVAPPVPTASTLPSGPSAAPANPSTTTPVPTFDPRTTLTPVSGSAAPSGPVMEAPRAQVINAIRFDLNYQVEQRGPSGISRVDLWVTRDDGKSWVWWSQHDGREAALKVNLGTSSNSQPEGLYGFRLVPVSGAGLSDATPTAGDSPDMRIVLDVTAPAVKIFPAIADPNAPDALVLQWEATDKNFSDDPISLEWCEGPGGPWHPVVPASTSDAPSGAGVAAKKLANTGRYSWHVPTGLPPRVYLKVTAKDAAGNTTEQVTREPILVDLTKPRAKITSIGTSLGPIVRP